MPATEEPNRPAPAGADDRELAIAGVVHDVNQMLAVISGRAELLLRQEPAPHSRLPRQHLEAILLAAADASAMLARLGPGREAPAVGAPGADPGAVVSSAALLVAPPGGTWADAPAPGAWALEPSLASAPLIGVPAGVLREVMVNLLANAVAAMPGGGCVRIGARRDGDRCLLTVADSGPGLPVDDPEAVFAAGYTTSGAGGRGIGLAACRQLLAAHGATLRAARDGGPGAVFTIDAPVGREAPPSRPVASAAAPPALAVCVVDDEPAVREMLADVLAELGCSVTCHRDGPGALAAGAPGDAALALVDRRLPGLEGPAVAARLRERSPDLVVALMTGWDAGDAAPVAGDADFVLRKPLSLATLQDLLVRADALWRGRRGDADL